MSSTTFLVEFSAICHTRIGETAYICGNTKELGQWQPSNGVRLFTDSTIYPRWNSIRKILLTFSQTVEFKLCFIQSNNSVRWQNMSKNRTLKIIKDSRVILTEDQPDLVIVPHQTHLVECHKHTWQILQELQSDSEESDKQNYSHTMIEQKFAEDIKYHSNENYDRERLPRKKSAISV